MSMSKMIRVRNHFILWKPKDNTHARKWLLDEFSKMAITGGSGSKL